MTPATREPGVDASPALPVVVIGAGPAGLTAAYELTRRGVPDRRGRAGPAGRRAARTVTYKGFRFDIGGHRFFTKVPAVQRALARDARGRDFLRRPRLSRIYYGGRFFDYPLKPMKPSLTLGLSRAIVDRPQLPAREARPIRPEVSFADWVSNRFGRRLFEIFFERLHGEGVGHPLHGASGPVGSPAHQGLVAQDGGADGARSAEPEGRRGDGQDAHRRVRVPAPRPRDDVGSVPRSSGGCGRPRRSSEPRCRRLGHDGSRGVTVASVDAGGRRREVAAAHVISTMPIRAARARALDRAPRPQCTAAADRLKYRDFLTVALDHRPAAGLSRQLDLRARPVREGRTHPELQELEPRHGPGPAADLPRARVFLLRGRRSVDDGR